MALANAGGCDFPVRPSLKATEAPVFWSAEDDTGAVLLTSAPPILPADSDVLATLSEAAAYLDEQGAHTLHDLGNGQRLHVVRLAGAAADGALAAIVPLDLDGFGRIEAVTRLLKSLYARAIPPDTRLTRQQLARARRMLQAVDGHRNGANQQEIADVIFRLKKPTRDEWQAAPERYATMDLIKDGLAMVAGGYRKLLRHRRRS
nr:DUF2285 domain-containing protein [Xanthobacter autotrophicus]